MMEPMGTFVAELLANETFVRRLARSLEADETGADDLVQETWIAALQRGPFDRFGLRSWLVRVLRNLAASRLRSRVRREARERACARPVIQPDTAELVERIEVQHRLVAAVLGLPEVYREVVLRHYFRGESTRVMAASLGKPEATVRTRLRRAREQLRKELCGRNFGNGYAAFAAVHGALDAATRVGSEMIMKKTLIQAPLIVSALFGAGLGVGGSVLILDEPAADSVAAERSALRPAGLSAPEIAPSSAARDESPESSASARVPLRPPPEFDAQTAAVPSEDPRLLLLSSDRMDQLRAIRMLTTEGTAEAHAILLESFMATHDPILMAMLEEAILEADMQVAPAVCEGFRTCREPERLERLSSMLVKLAEKNPALAPMVVELLADALRDPGPNGERLAGLDLALVAMGEQALDAISAYLSDPLSDPAGVQIAALALTKIDPRAAEEVRQRLGESLDSLLAAVADPFLADERRQALLQRTTSLAWAATNRPAEEHAPLSALLLDHLFRATDQQQAQTLAWGVTSLKGLSDEARAKTVQSILDALDDQASPDLRQSYVWAVNQLATDYGNRALDQSYHDIRGMVQEAMLRAGQDAGFSVQLLWLWEALEKHRQKMGG